MPAPRILHLAFDDKFVDTAFRIFEEAFPGQNEVVITGDPRAELRYIKNRSFEQLGERALLDPQFLRRLRSHDCVILHSLQPQMVRLVCRAPTDIRFVWCGWGFDYYDLIVRQFTDLLLPRTLQAFVAAAPPLTLRRLATAPQRWARTYLDRRDKLEAVRRIRIFAPVLHEDYARAAQAGIIDRLPRYMAWSYGNLEEDLLREHAGQTVAGDDVLLGNNASFENNHLDVLPLLAKAGARRVVVPLSYGLPSYRQLVLEEGARALGAAFCPMTDFLPVSEYVRQLRSCGSFVMNSVRQQAVGNIIIMLHLGARVFLREECPTYRFFKQEGAVLFSIQALQANPGLLDGRLEASEIERNRAILRRHWSREVIADRTRRLVAEAVS